MSNREKILNILLDSRGKYVSGECIAEMLDISRNAVWKSIARLRSNGIVIEASKKLGYRISSDVDILSLNEIRDYLVNDLRGITINLLNTVDSTNEYAKILAKRGAPEYTLVVADTQTQGKGRMGRSFNSPSGTGIYMSIILRPKTSIGTSQLITSCVAVAISKAIDMLGGCTTQIKWVNDVFLNGKKISGTLTEGALDFETNSFKYAIVGIGVNVRSIKDVFDTELSSIATSIEDETGLQLSRSRLIAEIMNGIHAELTHIDDRKFLKEYTRRSMVIGKEVIVSYDGLDTIAKAIGIDESAGLIIQLSDGSTKILNSGEARIKMPITDNH